MTLPKINGPRRDWGDGPIRSLWTPRFQHLCTGRPHRLVRALRAALRDRPRPHPRRCRGAADRRAHLLLRLPGRALSGPRRAAPRAALADAYRRPRLAPFLAREPAPTPPPAQGP